MIAMYAAVIISVGFPKLVSSEFYEVPVAGTSESLHTRAEPLKAETALEARSEAPLCLLDGEVLVGVVQLAGTAEKCYA